MAGEQIFRSSTHDCLNNALIDFELFLSAAYQDIERRRQNMGLANQVWSWPELLPAKQDLELLCQFLRGPHRWLERIISADSSYAHRYVAPGHLPVASRPTFRHAAGMLITIALATQLASMEEAVGVWPHLSQCCGSHVRACLFSDPGQPRPNTYDLIQSSVIERKMRNHFDEKPYHGDDIRTHDWVHTLRMHVGLTLYDLTCREPLIKRLFRRTAKEDNGSQEVSRTVFRAMLDTARPNAYCSSFTEVCRVLRRYAIDRSFGEQIGHFDANRVKHILQNNPWTIGQRGNRDILSHLLERVDREAPLAKDLHDHDRHSVIRDFHLVASPARGFRLETNESALSRISHDAEHVTMRIGYRQTHDSEMTVLKELSFYDGIAVNRDGMVFIPADQLHQPCLQIELVVNEVDGTQACCHQEELELWDVHSTCSWFDLRTGRPSHPPVRGTDSRWLLMPADLTPTPQPDSWFSLGYGWKAWAWHGPWRPDGTRGESGKLVFHLDEMAQANFSALTPWVSGCKVSLTSRVGTSQSCTWYHAGMTIKAWIEIPAEVCVTRLMLDGVLMEIPTSLKEHAPHKRSEIIQGNNAHIGRPGTVPVRMELVDIAGHIVEIRASPPIRVIGALHRRGENLPRLLYNKRLFKQADRSLELLRSQLYVEPPPLTTHDIARVDVQARHQAHVQSSNHFDDSRREFVVLEGRFARNRLNVPPPGRKASPMRMPLLGAYGAPLIVGRPFNEHPRFCTPGNARMTLAQSTVDSGHVRRAHRCEETGQIEIYIDKALARRLPAGPDQRHTLWTCQTNGLWSQLDLQQGSGQDDQSLWHAQRTDSNAPLIGLALAADGVWIGGWWDLEQMHLDIHDLPTFWRWARWSRFPVLSPECIESTTRWALSSPASLLATLVARGPGTVGPVPGLRYGDDIGDEQVRWSEVAATLLADWRPTLAEADDVLTELAGDITQQSIYNVAPMLLEFLPWTARRLFHQWWGPRFNRQLAMRAALDLGVVILPESFTPIVSHPQAMQSHWLVYRLEERFMALAENVARHPIVQCDPHYVRCVIRHAFNHAGTWSDFCQNFRTASYARAVDCLSSFLQGRRLIQFTILAELLGYTPTQG